MVTRVTIVQMSAGVATFYPLAFSIPTSPVRTHRTPPGNICEKVKIANGYILEVPWSLWMWRVWAYRGRNWYTILFFCFLTNLFAANFLANFIWHIYTFLFDNLIASKIVKWSKDKVGLWQPWQPPSPGVGDRFTGEHLAVLQRLTFLDNLHVATEAGNCLRAALSHLPVLALSEQHLCCLHHLSYAIKNQLKAPKAPN